MKGKKRGRTSPQPEECGVWLDASQLKKKPHQAVIPCTSSRFHPLSRRQTMDSVLVEFTQTKLPQLCTKQTSMYSFFSPAGNRNKQICVTDINTLAKETSPECEKRDMQEEPNVMKPSPTGGVSMCLKQSYSDHEPAEDQESIFLCKKYRDAEKPVRSGHTQNDWSHVPDNPENPVGSFSKASIFRSLEKSLNPPMDYCTAGYDSKDRNNLSDSSVSKCLQEDYNKEDSLYESQLFTQDTQGNRVICHRSTSERRLHGVPLQDKTNVSWDIRSPMKGTLQTLFDEDSLHKMFTQDSEGNMVIKH